MEKPESFEVTDYGAENTEYNRAAAIKQIVSEIGRSNPSFAVLASIAGNRLTLKYHCYEMHLHDHLRLRAVADQADLVFKETLKHLKKEFKSRTKKALSLKEMKGASNHNLQKVSLNERYYYLAWRVYELS